MAEGGKDTDILLDHTEDHEEEDKDDTTGPFQPNRASTPEPQGQQIEMQTISREKSGLPEKSYTETSFGAQSRSEEAWVAAKNLFPNMSSSELDVFYDTKGKLQVKMFGSGKKTYDMFTTKKGTSEQQINPKLSKKIKTALGESIYEIEKDRQEKLSADREKYKKIMAEKREEINRKQKEKEALEDKDGQTEQVQKLDQEISVLKTERREANESFLQSVEAEKSFQEDIQVFEDYEEEENLDEAVDALRRQKAAIEVRLDVENNALTNKFSTPERKEMARNKIKELEKKLEEVERDEKMIKEKLGDNLSKLQKDREELERKNKEDMEIINDENATSFEKTAAEERIERRNEEIRQLATQIEERERERPLRERVQEIFKKYGVTVASILLAAGVTIGAVIGSITNALKSMGKGIAKGLKAIGKKNSLSPSGTNWLDCFFPLQSCWPGRRFSGRTCMAVDFGCCGLFG